MKILITGANGYIGSKVVKKLCDFNIEVIASDINNDNIDHRATFVRANIFDRQENWLSYFGNPDICLHLAWRDGFIHNSDAHMLDLSSHFYFITNLINNGISRIAIMGTMHEIGYWEGKVDEQTPCRPLSKYGIAKNALREAIEIYSKEKKVIFQWLRAFYIFGDDSFGNSIFCKIKRAENNGDTFFPFTMGKNQYDFINVDELSTQISLAIIQKDIDGIINCCSGVPVSLANQIEGYIKNNGFKIKLDYGKYPDRAYDSPCIYGDNSKIKLIISKWEGEKNV